MAKQTTFETDDSMSESNKSITYGIPKLVNACMKRLNLNGILDSFKERGVPLNEVIKFMIIKQLSGNSSMNKWQEVSESLILRTELCNGYVIKRKTMERALELLTIYFEEITNHLWAKLKELYPNMNTDVRIDGSHIPRFGPRGHYTKPGEGGGTVQLQDQFMVAQLAETGLPVMIEAYPGNYNDPMQYSDFIPQLMFYLEQGSMVVFDNGGAVKEILDDIKERGMEYTTRVKMNLSDDEKIANHRDEMVYVCRDTTCIMSCFDSSDRTNYLFFSVDRYILGSYAEDRKQERSKSQKEIAKNAIEHNNLKGLVKLIKNDYVEVTIEKYAIQKKLDLLDDSESIQTGNRCGWFKIQCSKRLSPAEVLMLYRHRVGIEHLIKSLKSMVNLRPLRVWSERTERGAILLGMIAQLFVSMVRNDLAPRIQRKKIDGKIIDAKVRPSENTIIEDLDHWTVTLIYRSEWRTDRIYSNETPLTEEISSILDRYIQ